jgi:hypothetical protein
LAVSLWNGNDFDSKIVSVLFDCSLLGRTSNGVASEPLLNEQASNDGTFSPERLELGCLCQSSALVSEILPIMDKTWSRLVCFWVTWAFCKVSIYVTDKDESANRKQLEKIQGLALYQTGAIHFCRPETFLKSITITHATDWLTMAGGARHVILLGLFWLVHPPFLGSFMIHQDRIFNDILSKYYRK